MEFIYSFTVSHMYIKLFNSVGGGEGVTFLGGVNSGKLKQTAPQPPTFLQSNAIRCSELPKQKKKKKRYSGFEKS